MTEATPSNYPLQRAENDARFSFDLVTEVGVVLERHGYPKISSGDDFVSLQFGLLDFLYERPGVSR